MITVIMTLEFIAGILCFCRCNQISEQSEEYLAAEDLTDFMCMQTLTNGYFEHKSHATYSLN